MQSNFDKMLSSVGNTTYFSKKFDYIDSGTKRAVSGGSTDTTATANQSIFLCKKIGAWSNGTQVTGTVTHLQTGNTAGSTSTNTGDAEQMTTYQHGSQSYNTDYRIDRFMDSITNYNSAGGIGNVCTYYFIPC